MNTVIAERHAVKCCAGCRGGRIYGHCCVYQVLDLISFAHSVDSWPSELTILCSLDLWSMTNESVHSQLQSSGSHALYTLHIIACAVSCLE